MASILTNQSAITALQNLNASNRTLQTTQNRISTGMRVATASDNAAYWSMATTMRSDHASLSSVKDALGLGGSSVDVMSSALSTTTDLLKQMKAKLTAAAESSVDRAKVQSEIKQLQDQIKSVADASSFSGENWLSVDSSVTNFSSKKDIVASMTRSSSGVAITTITLDTKTVSLYDANGSKGLIDKSRTVGGTTSSIATIDVSSLSNSDADKTKMQNYINMIDAAGKEVAAAAADVGATKTRISTQTTFISNLMDSITGGVGQLVDADMNEESTRLQALQVQQQLGVQALSIANQSTSQIMSLFRG